MTASQWRYAGTAHVFKQRKAGCSCWAGWEMSDGTFFDPGCDAEEWHNRKADDE